MMLKELFKKCVLGVKKDSETYIKHLRKIGCTIGENCVIFVPSKTYIDVTRPYLIHIGDNVKITQGVTILSHGYDWSVLEQKYHEICGSAGEIFIGNNVFIGMNSTLLKGVHVGNNVIIGAESLVNKDIPDNVVVGGNPAKILMTVEEYYEKRKAAQLDEAYCVYKNFQNKWGGVQTIPEGCFHEFFWLFDCEIKDNEFAHPLWKSMTQHDDYAVYLKTPHMFKSYDEFISYCEKRYNSEKQIME